MLNAMQQLMTGSSEYFDAPFLNALKDCFDKTEPDLRDANNRAWQGLVDYFDNNGYGSDPWGSRNGSWYEYDPRVQNFHNMTIYEPCNYASNMAYYHDATEMCHNEDKFSMTRDSYVAIIQSFSFMAFASSVMHGSNTRLGEIDGHNIGVLLYAIHQAHIENLRALGASSIITDLKSTNRALTGVEMARSMSDMFLTMPVSQWRSHFKAMDRPPYDLTFASIIVSVLSLTLDNQQLGNIFQSQSFVDLGSLISIIEHGTVDFLVPALMDIFDLKQDQRDFILNQYLPEVCVLLTYGDFYYKPASLNFCSFVTSQPTCIFAHWKNCA